jgi:hypothetical protein
MSIPLLIGIIGHRELPEEYRSDLEAEISQALEQIRSQMPNTQIVLVSSLADGADRLGARVGLAKGMELIVPTLPSELWIAFMTLWAYSHIHKQSFA